MRKQFLYSARQVLLRRGTKINFVDIGSRNGVIELAAISEFVNAYGFEPNQVEYEKLVHGTTDASRFGIHSPNYRALTYSSYALADTVGRKPFYITRGPGASGMLEPNYERLKEIRWKGYTYTPNFAEEVFTVVRVVDVEVNTLKHFAQQQNIRHIDYLKIDVEGSAYEVFLGAGNELLKQVGIIKAEVEFIPFRKGQKLFSEVDLLLRECGFDLLRYEIAPEQIGFKERTSPWSFGPEIGIPERFGQPLQADAIYVNRGIIDPQRALAQAMILLEHHYLDEALFILQHKAGLPEDSLCMLLAQYRGSWASRALNAFVRLATKLSLAR